MKNLLRFVYKSIPLKKHILIAIRTFYIPSSNIYQHLHFKDFFNVKLDAKHHFLLRHNGSKFENDIFWRGLNNAWEKQSLNIWIKLSRKSFIIFDVGANTGVYSLIAGAVNNEVKIYAFEPLERMLDILKMNVHKNKFPIQSFGLAVSDSEKQAYIYDRPFEIFRQASLNVDYNSGSQDVIKTEVKCVSLDHFMHTQKIKRIDLIKIDVESHEFEVLTGLKKGLINHKPTILLEILNEQKAKKIELFLSEFEYVMYAIDEEKGIMLKNKTSSSNQRNFLCIPVIRLKDTLILLEENVFKV